MANVWQTCLCFLLLVFVVESSASEPMARTGREYRKLHPRTREISGIRSTSASISRQSRSPVTIRRRIRGYPRIHHQRVRKFSSSPIRRSLLHFRYQPRLDNLEETLVTKSYNYTSTDKHGDIAILRPKANPLIARTKPGNGESKYATKRRRNPNPTSSLSRQRKYLINKCKNIKIGKCCKGWRRHSLTGYCLPSCEKSCVHGTCENEYKCKCNKGFQGPLCNIDNNECAKDVCDHGCVNIYGGFRCICDEGFAVQIDGSCRKIPPCKLKQCEHKCYDDNGEAKCVCPRGYRLSQDGRSCEDINECVERDIKCDPDDQLRSCKNLPGSYICSCREGFFYHRFFKTCADSNECLMETHDCDTSISRCVNTDGGYKCVCREDFTGDGRKCSSLLDESEILTEQIQNRFGI